MSVTVRSLAGPDFDAAIPALANLRIKVFRAWPYLYDGNPAYEEGYLARFRHADRAFLAAAFDGDTIVGAATAAPMAGEAAEFRGPFERAGFDTSKIFYFAESLLLPAYRGQGAGVKFFEAREAHARSFGSYSHAVFCGVVRASGHPMKPETYVPLDAFWRKRGFDKLDGMTTAYSWKDVGAPEETEKSMQFWMKQL
ncbi:GNAT family N-acetyltransferase [Anderseniella sp. Alg231-50]|uniref:GNAT family N-acetyltransferase n=1 Tax=Anderseniella sp. Alg231-50 TaxID=1922226 RepID=UPI000D55AEC3